MTIKSSSNGFKGTNIKTPFEVMRASAIINANIDTRGLSLINFNLTTFLKKGREEDCYFILSLWAVIPIKNRPQHYIKHPQTGQQALIKRTEELINHLKKRSDTSDYFIEIAHNRMTQNVNKIFNELRNNDDIMHRA